MLEGPQPLCYKVIVSVENYTIRNYCKAEVSCYPYLPSGGVVKNL